MRRQRVVKLILRSILAFTALAIVPIFHNLVTNNPPGYLKFLQSHSAVTLIAAVALCVVLAVSTTLAETPRDDNEAPDRIPRGPAATSERPRQSRKARKDYTWVAVTLSLATGVTGSILWDRHEKESLRKETRAEVSAMQRCLAGSWSVVSIQERYSDFYGSTTLQLRDGGVGRWTFDGQNKATRGGKMTMTGVISAGRYRGQELVLSLTGSTEFTYVVQPGVLIPSILTVTPVGGITTSRLALGGVQGKAQRDNPASSTTYRIKCADRSMTMTWTTGSIVLGKA